MKSPLELTIDDLTAGCVDSSFQIVDRKYSIVNGKKGGADER